MRRTAVLVLGRRQPLAQDVLEAVQALHGAGAEVTVVTHDPVAVDGVPVIVVGTTTTAARPTGPKAIRLARLAWRTLLRRTPGAVLARAVGRSADSRGALDAADVVVAADSDAIETVWRHARRRPGPVVVTGVPAGVRALRGPGTGSR